MPASGLGAGIHQALTELYFTDTSSDFLWANLLVFRGLPSVAPWPPGNLSQAQRSFPQGWVGGEEIINAACALPGHPRFYFAWFSWLQYINSLPVHLASRWCPGSDLSIALQPPQGHQLKASFWWQVGICIFSRHQCTAFGWAQIRIPSSLRLWLHTSNTNKHIHKQMPSLRSPLYFIVMQIAQIKESKKCRRGDRRAS